MARGQTATPLPLPGSSTATQRAINAVKNSTCAQKKKTCCLAGADSQAYAIDVHGTDSSRCLKVNVRDPVAMCDG